MIIFTITIKNVSLFILLIFVRVLHPALALGSWFEMLNTQGTCTYNVAKGKCI